MFFDKMRGVRGSLRKHSAMVPVRTLAIAFAVLAVSAAAALADDKPVKIPLKEVWALNMPETRDIRQLDAVRNDPALLESLRRALKPKLDAKQASMGFVVLGEGNDALRTAHEVLVGGDKPRVRLPAGQKITAVFFSYESPFYVHLDEVIRKECAIRITYRFVPHETKETTEQIALIPLGELAAGKYSVRVELNAMDKKYAEQGFSTPSKADALRIVCRAFHFIVVDN